MMMNKLVAALALCALGTTSAMASVFIGAATAGGSQVQDFSGDGLVAFNLDLKDNAPVTLTYELTAADLSAPLAFNAVLANLASLPVSHVNLTLGGITFSTVGTAERFFGGTASVLGGGSPTAATILLNSPEYYELAVGNPYGRNGQADWTLGTAGLKAGDRITLTVAVPEPEGWALAVAGLAMAGVIARCRKG